MNERITYYSNPDVIYDEEVDVVKGASLLGTEVDKNFNTLEGRGIKNVEIDKDEKSLIITLLNGKKYTCETPYEEGITSIDFDYDKDFGVLSVYINKSETPIEIDGFITKGDVEEIAGKNSVFSDTTLSGDGTATSPLSLSRTQRTGMFKPVIDAVEELPTEGMIVGDRYVTIEPVDVYGALYTYRGVKNIMRNIRCGKWRVARKWDWDDMLNALEPNRVNKSHHRKDCNVYLGHDANTYLAQEVYNFNPVLCGYAYEEENPHVVYNGMRTAWWTGSNEDGRNAYYKRIDDGVNGVYQDIVDGKNYYSVRLVRDYEDNEVLSAEEIMGTTYPVTLMPSETKGLRVWLAVNFSSELVPVTDDFSHTNCYVNCDEVPPQTETETITDTIIVDDMQGARFRPGPEEWPDAVAMAYINEWDGEKWLKMALGEYDTFYMIEKGDYYRLENGEVVPVHGADEKTLADNTNMIKALMTLHGTDEVTQGMLTVAYENQGDYIPHYTPTINGNRISYLDIPASEIPQGYLMNDLARFVGAIYGTYGLDPAVYPSNTDGRKYAWDERLGLKGSNYVRHTADGEIEWIDEEEHLAYTLVHDIVEDFTTAATPSFPFSVNLGGREINVQITVDSQH